MITLLKVYMKVFVVLAMLKYKKKQLIIQHLLKLLNENPLNNDNKLFQYSVIPSLYNEKIGKNCCRVS